MSDMCKIIENYKWLAGSPLSEGIGEAYLPSFGGVGGGFL